MARPKLYALVQTAERLKTEDARVEASKIWLNEILPNWDREKNSRRTRDLWWNGLPSAVRGKVWRMAIGECTSGGQG
jgi:hypothetical protein